MAPQSSTSAGSSKSKESHMRRMKYIKHKYTTPEPVETCVFRIPDILKETYPGAYIPQIIGLGPYHHFRPQLQLVASQKRAAIEYFLVKWGLCPKGRVHLQLNTVLSQVYKNLERFEPMIRSCYDQYLDLDEETLAWIVMVDAIVLICFVDWYVRVAKQQKQPVNTTFEKMVPDLFKLENQVPIILIHTIRERLQLCFGKDLDPEKNDRSGLLLEFCRIHSPLELAPADEEKFDDKKKGHLLRLMYQMIMKNYKADPELKKDDKTERLGLHWVRELVEKAMECAGLAGCKARELFLHLVEEFNSAVEKAESTGLKVPRNIHQLSEILGKFDKTLKLQQHDTPPCEVPSVSRLNAILNVKFKPLPKECGIRNIHLQVPDFILYLPKIKFGSHTEVIVRNLVAYESTILLTDQNDPTRLRDFVDLMCGLIRSEKDAKLLRDAGIIEEGGLSDAEIARICRGIHKSDKRPDDGSSVHKTVNEANKKYNDLRYIKYEKSIMNFFAVGSKIFRAMLPLLIFLFLGFQSVCEVYDCRARTNNVSSGRNDLYNLNQYLEVNPHELAKFVMLPRKLLLPQ